MGKLQVRWGRIALHIVEVALLHLACCLPILECLMVNNNAYAAIVVVAGRTLRNTQKIITYLGIPNVE